MGCNVSPYRGGVLKYKETRTETVDSISGIETKTFFTASKNCIVKVKPLTNVGYAGALYINDTRAAELTSRNTSAPNVFGSLVDREELFFSPAIAGMAEVYYQSLLLLLKPGDKLQLHYADDTSTFTNVQYKIYVYEWE